ncbi:MAG: GNAT family N-acetyltransferase [Candidatus Dojkabacteria bacterium]|nr:GNAT family N-acetyltransferase [Candidatus Dojkabacteria bacterium]
MNIQFQEPISDEQWDEYVLQLPTYSFLLSSARYNYLQSILKQTFRHLVFNNEQFLGVIDGYVDSIKIFGKYLECKHNPMLVSGLNDGEKEEIYREIFNKLKSIAVENNCFFIRLSPLVQYDEIYDKVSLEFNAQSAPVHPQDALISQYFDISKSEEDLRHDMSSSTRNNINKLMKNTDISVKIFQDDSVFEVFSDFYNQTMQLKQYRGHSSSALLKEFKYQLDKGMIYFVVGYYKDKPIAVWQNSRFGKYMHVYQAGSDVGFREKNIRVTYLLFWETVKLCKELGVETLDLFGGMLPEDLQSTAKNPWKGVNDFKVSLGGTKVTYSHPKDLPLKQYYSIYQPYAKFRVELKNHTVDW